MAQMDGAERTRSAIAARAVRKALPLLRSLLSELPPSSDRRR